MKNIGTSLSYMCLLLLVCVSCTNYKDKISERYWAGYWFDDLHKTTLKFCADGEIKNITNQTYGSFEINADTLILDYNKNKYKFLFIKFYSNRFILKSLKILGEDFLNTNNKALYKDLLITKSIILHDSLEYNFKEASNQDFLIGTWSQKDNDYPINIIDYGSNNDAIIYTYSDSIIPISSIECTSNDSLNIGNVNFHISFDEHKEQFTLIDKSGKYIYDRLLNVDIYYSKLNSLIVTPEAFVKTYKDFCKDKNTNINELSYTRNKMYYYNNDKVDKINEIKYLFKEDFISGCKTILYDELLRNTENYIQQKFTFTGKVLQVLEDEDRFTTILVDVNNEIWNFDQKIICLAWLRKNSESRIIENDKITFYGVVSDRYTYTSTLGQQITVPRFAAIYIDLPQNIKFLKNSPIYVNLMNIYKNFNSDEPNWYTAENNYNIAYNYFLKMKTKLNSSDIATLENIFNSYKKFLNKWSTQGLDAGDIVVNSLLKIKLEKIKNVCFSN